MIFYFTATGNCLAAAKNIAKTLDTEVVSIPQAIKEEKKEYADDVIGIIFPVYAGGTPRMVYDFLQQTELKADYIFVIATYGMLSGNPFTYVEKAIGGRYKVNYANKLKMVDNYLDGFEMKSQIENLPKKDVEGHLQLILSDLLARKQGRCNISFLASIQTALMKPFNKKCTDPATSERFTVDDNCIKCGICSQVCPGANIRLTDHVEFLNNSCQGCYACIQACPKHAIHLKSERSSVRYRNKDVELAEIIKANNQNS